MKTTTGTCEVLYASWAPSYRMNDIIITLSEEPEIAIRVGIKRDDVLGGPDIQMDFKKAKHLTITVVNPHKLSHMGVPEPVEVGTLQGKKLFFSFRVDMFGNYASFAVTYAFLLGE
ncbi:MAG: hypothetical protein LBQ57_01455 [Spirochaetales bacterium]|jgi:hypothetical protein|nr:hypothetical protein [Spirochaetales bacterium]